MRRVKKTSEKQDRLIEKIALENKKATVSELQKNTEPYGYSHIRKNASV